MEASLTAAAAAQDQKGEGDADKEMNINGEPTEQALKTAVNKFISINENGDKTAKFALVEDINRDSEFSPHISSDRLRRINQCAILSELMNENDSLMVGFMTVLAIRLPKNGSENYEFGIGEIFNV